MGEGEYVAKGLIIAYTVRTHIEYYSNHGDVLVLTPVRRGQWASRAKRSKRGGVEKNGVVLREQYEQVFRAEPSTS